MKKKIKLENFNEFFDFAIWNPTRKNRSMPNAAPSKHIKFHEPIIETPQEEV